MMVTSVVQYDRKEGEAVTSSNPECRGRHAEHVTSITNDTGNDGIGFGGSVIQGLTCTD